MSMARVSVGTSVTSVLSASTYRRGVILKALAANTDSVYLKLDSSATVLTTATGCPLDPGQFLVLASGINGNNGDYTNAITAIAASTQALSVTELP